MNYGSAWPSPLTGRPLTRGRDQPAPLPSTRQPAKGSGCHPGTKDSPPARGSSAPVGRGTGLLCFFQMEIEAHESHSSRIERCGCVCHTFVPCLVCACACVCLHVCLCHCLPEDPNLPPAGWIFMWHAHTFIVPCRARVSGRMYPTWLLCFGDNLPLFLLPGEGSPRVGAEGEALPTCMIRGGLHGRRGMQSGLSFLEMLEGSSVF